MNESVLERKESTARAGAASQYPPYIRIFQRFRSIPLVKTFWKKPVLFCDIPNRM